MLTEFGVPHECQVVSAHRTPAWMAEYASTAADRGLEVIIAGAGGAAHLPGMVAAQTVLPVIGVPVQSAALNGLDSLLSIVQMPKGVPVATVAIGAAGAANAGAARGRHPRDVASRAAREARRRTATSMAADGQARRTLADRDSRHPPGLDDRRARRRPARPHVRHGGAPARLPRPHARARARHADRTDRRRRDQRAVRRPRRRARLRAAASTS